MARDQISERKGRAWIPCGKNLLRLLPVRTWKAIHPPTQLSAEEEKVGKMFVVCSH